MPHMYDPQDDGATREAAAVGTTEMAPTVTAAPASDSVVDAFAWSQEDGSAEPLPYVDDPYEPAPGTGRRPVTVPSPAPVPGRKHPPRWPRYALGVGILVALM